MPSFDIVYPGFDQRTGNAQVVWSRGTDPSFIEIECAPDSSLNPAIGNVELLVDGAPVITLFNCAGDSQLHSGTTAGSRWSMKIMDRRWKWNEGGGTISGVYNRRYPDGSIEATTLKTPRELVNLLLDALGETNYDTSAVSTALTDPPEVQWDHDRPVEALSALLKVLGVELVLKLSLNNPVQIVVPGTGATPPLTPLTAPPRITMEGVAKPESLQLIGGPDVIESLLELEPVGKDEDGQWKLVNSLGFTPEGGWNAENPEFFSGITGASAEQIAQRVKLAQAYVFRAYRVKQQATGTTTVPGLGVAINNWWQYKLLGRKLSKVARADGEIQWEPAELYGLWWNQGFKASNEIFGTKVDVEFGLEGDDSIVLLSRPLRRGTNFATASYAFPKLYLRTAYTVLDATSRAPYRYTRSLSIAANGSGAKPVYRDDVYRTISAPATANTGPETWTLGTITDSQATTEAVADYYLAAAARDLYPLEGRDYVYAGFVALDLDGHVSQITWSLNGGVATTQISTHTEHSRVVPKPNLRRRMQASRQREHLEQPRRSGIQAIRELRAARGAGIVQARGPLPSGTLPAPPTLAARVTQPPAMISPRWVACHNISASTDIAPYAPFKVANNPTPGDTANARELTLKVLPLTETGGRDGAQPIGFAGPDGIPLGKINVGTFTFPTTGRISGAGTPGTVYATDAYDLLTSSTTGDTLTEFEALHKVATAGANEDWLIAQRVASQGTPTIRFSIVSVDEYCSTALVTVLSSPSAGKVPGENEYGQVTVHDPAGCFFDEAEADLIGRQGFAVYLYSRAVLDCDNEYDSALHWEVHSLCCP